MKIETYKLSKLEVDTLLNDIKDLIKSIYKFIIKLTMPIFKNIKDNYNNEKNIKNIYNKTYNNARINLAIKEARTKALLDCKNKNSYNNTTKSNVFNNYNNENLQNIKSPLIDNNIYDRYGKL